jgi:RNA polymerase sigma factor (sigma-70 family)|tara:strand:+ start:49 stop:528 length:480 start_codon:yes stop_codon:yes gene_type:complete
MDNIENYLKNPDVVNIMNAVSNKYSKSIDLDEIDSIKMLTLWKCIKKFDPDRGAKFTSYLYQQLSFAFKNELKKKKQMWYRDNVQIDGTTSSDSYDSFVEFRDTISGLPEEVSTILQQRFLGNMTMVEIARANGYSRETARRRLKTAIKICKKSNEIIA